MTDKIRVATASLAGCFGCHMSLLDIDERILELVELVEFDRSPITDIKILGDCDLGILEGGVANVNLGNKVAGKYGLVFTLPQELKELYPRFGIDTPAANGDESYELPVPASYVVDRDGMIILDFVEIDYTKRLEPDLILKALEKA